MVQLQIGAHLVLVDVKLGLLGFLEVVAPVPAFGLELLAVLLDFGLDVFQLFLGLLQRRFPNLVEQGIHLVGRLGHACLQCQRGIVFVPHQAGLLQAGLQQFAHHGLVVGVIAVVAAVGVRLEDLFAQGTVVGILQERHHAGVLQSKHPLALQSLLAGCLSGRCHQRGGQTGEIGFVVDDQLVGIRFLQHVLPEGELKQGDTAVQFAQFLLVGLTEVGSAAHKVLVGFFEQFRLLLVQPQAFAVVVHLLDAGKESGVERDIVAVSRKQGRQLLAQGLQLGRSVATVLSTENEGHAREQRAATVESGDGIVEVGHRTLAHDGVDFPLLFLHPLEEGLAVVGHRNLLKGRHAVGSSVLGEERVRPCSVSLAVGSHRSTQQGSHAQVSVDVCLHAAVIINI